VRSSPTGKKDGTSAATPSTTQRDTTFRVRTDEASQYFKNLMAGSGKLLTP